MPSVKINDVRHTFVDGLSILQAVRQTGIELPTLCSDERLKPMGGCRLCIVQVQGWPRPVTACTTSLTDGVEIQTHTPELERDRRTLLKLLAQNYPVECARRLQKMSFIDICASTAWWMPETSPRSPERWVLPNPHSIHLNRPTL